MNRQTVDYTDEHLVDNMAVASDYYIFHCVKDLAVNKQKHSDLFVEKMAAKHKVNYYAVPEREHCDLTEEMWVLYHKCIVDAIEKNSPR